MQLTDYIDLQSLQEAQDAFASANHLALVLVDTAGNFITQASNYDALCSEFKADFLCRNSSFLDTTTHILIENQIVAKWFITTLDTSLSTATNFVPHSNFKNALLLLQILAKNFSSIAQKNKKIQEYKINKNQLQKKIEERVLSQQKDKTEILIKEVSKRRKIQLELEKQTLFFEKVIENLPIGIYVKDTHNFQYTIWNKAAANIFGKRPNEVLGKTSDLIFPSSTAEEFNSIDLQIFKNKNTYKEMAKEHQTPKGLAFLNIIKVPIVTKKGECEAIVGIVENVTARRKTEMELQIYQNQLEELVETRTKELTESHQKLEQQNLKLIGLNIELEQKSNELNEKNYDYTILNEELTSQNEELNVMNEENQKMNYELERNQKILLKAQQIAKIGNWEFDLATRQITWSDYLYIVLGYSPYDKKISPKDIAKIVHRDDLIPLQRSIAKAIKEQSIHNIIYRYYDKNGDLHIAREVAEIEYNHHHIPVRVFGTTQDITDIYTIKKALQESQLKYQYIFEKSTIGILHFDTHFLITDCNESLLTILNSNKENLIGIHIHKSFDNKEINARIQETLQGKTTQFSGEYFSFTKNKRIFIKADFVPIFSPDKQITGGIGIIEDITERKRMEERSKRSKLYRTLRGEMWELAAKQNLKSEDEFTNRLLNLVGNRLLPSRISLLKRNENGDFYVYNEWTKRKEFNSDRNFVFPKKVLEHIKIEKYIELPMGNLEYLYEQKIFPYLYKEYINNILHTRKTKSFLIFPYEVNTCLEGFIFFDWCENDYKTWIQGDIYTGLDMGRMLSVALSKLRTENILRENEEKYRTLVENSNDGIFIETERLITFANQQFCDMIAYSKNEILKLPFTKIIAPEEVNKVLDAQRKRYVENKKLETIETNLLSKDEQYIPVEFSSSLIHYNNQKSIMTIVRDISQRKRAEEERSRLVAAIEQIHEGIVITNKEGIIEYINPTFEQMSGYTQKEIRGFHTKIFKSGKHNPDFYRNMWETIRKEKTWSGNLINRRKDGSLYEEHMVISPIKNLAGKVINYVAVKRDVTEEIRMEQQLKQTQKLQAIGTLAGGIAHDFNNILMGIQIHIELLKIQSEEKFYPFFNKIESSILKAKDLVKQLLTFSRQNNEEYQPILVGEVVKESLKLIRSPLPSTTKIIQKIDDCGFILGSSTEIHQIIMNICTNACDAMEGNGTIRVRLKKTNDFKPKTKNPLNIKKWVLLKISDTGKGMTEEVLERIYEPFFTTKDVGKGTGLGMSIVHGIVKRYNGFIHIESELDKGTCFYIYFPQIVEN